MSRFPSLFAPFPKLAVGAAAVLAALSLSPEAAHAACASGTPAGTCRVTVGGVQYDVTTFTGSYASDAGLFTGATMPWWGDSSKANLFSQQVANNIGRPGFGFRTYTVIDTLPDGSTETFDQIDYYIAGINENTGQYSSRLWAQASIYTPAAAPVPAPLPFLGAGAAFGYSRKLRKRVQGSRRPLA